MEDLERNVLSVPSDGDGLVFDATVGMYKNLVFGSGLTYTASTHTLSASGSGVSSIQPENNGTPYGSPLTGAVTMNFANCTVSSTFTITCLGAPSFSAITNGTNTTAAMVVGAGASLDYTSSGTIDANEVFGATVPASKAFVGSNSSHQVVDATGTVCSSSTLGICKVDGTTITASAGVISATGVLTNTWGFVFPGVPTASAYALRGATATCTIPANFTTPTTTASCGTNPTSNTIFTLKDGATTYGTVTLSSSCVATLATQSGTSKSVTVDDRLQFIAPASPDATAADIIIQLRCQ